MLAFYHASEFGRTGSVTVHAEGLTNVRVIETRNGKVTSDRVREHATSGERESYMAELDGRMAEFGYTRR